MSSSFVPRTCEIVVARRRCLVPRYALLLGAVEQRVGSRDLVEEAGGEGLVARVDARAQRGA
jgi:hypothetical protein